MAYVLEMWQSIVNQYEEPTNLARYTTRIRVCSNNSRDINAILGGLSSSVFVKVMHYKYVKEIWDKLHIIYEGDVKFKKAKLQTLRGLFESFKMREEINIVEYIQRVDEIVDVVRG